MSLLDAKRLTKAYGGVLALDDVTFSLPAGRIVGLLGPNGSGKTTLIKIINTLIVDYQGELLVDGMKPGAQTKKLVSYLPDVTFLPDDMRISSAVSLYSELFADFDRAKATEMIATLKLNAADTLQKLSKGMREKLQLALVMSRRAKLYVFDEPIAGVDPAARDFILGTILRNYQEDAGILLSTHLIHDIEPVIDHVLCLKEGRLALNGEAEALREEQGKSINELFREVFRFVP